MKGRHIVITILCGTEGWAVFLEDSQPNTTDSISTITTKDNLQKILSEKTHDAFARLTEALPL
jgi:hypothetical protein